MAHEGIAKRPIGRSVGGVWTQKGPFPSPENTRNIDIEKKQCTTIIPTTDFQSHFRGNAKTIIIHIKGYSTMTSRNPKRSLPALSPTQSSKLLTTLDVRVQNR